MYAAAFVFWNTLKIMPPGPAAENSAAGGCRYLDSYRVIPKRNYYGAHGYMQHRPVLCVMLPKMFVSSDGLGIPNMSQTIGMRSSSSTWKNLLNQSKPPYENTASTLNWALEYHTYFFLKEPLWNKSLYLFLPGYLKAQIMIGSLLWFKVYSLVKGFGKVWEAQPPALVMSIAFGMTYP